jgi:endonuclease/exonuclease/phosphatase family metal-dependent hydrolase
VKSERRARLKKIGRRLALGAVAAGAIALLASVGVALETRGEAQRALVPTELATPREHSSGPLRVLSYNVAHGRAESFHQSGLTRTEIDANLSAISALLRREAPALVALQEADGPSWWSGDFDHVEALGRGGGQALALRAANVSGLGLSYGTALLSQVACQSAEERTFPATPPTFSKGFLRATVRAWGRELDVFSIHLDFARQSKRDEQLALLAESLVPGRATILLGDFNCGWEHLRPWAEAHGFKAESSTPDSGLVTFPAHERRLDWILVSRELVLSEVRALPDRHSDHLALIGDVALAE